MSIPPRTIRRDARVFISAVTRELASVRKLVKKGLEDNDYHAVEQDNFPPDYRGLIDLDRERIVSCDAVIHIVGHCYGAEPGQRPPDEPRRSFTQLEYDVAVELGKPVYVFLIGDGFLVDPHDPEPPELQELQKSHRERIKSSGRNYNPTASIEQLDQKVRSLRLKVERLEEELQEVDQKVAVTGKRLGGRLVLVAILVAAALGAVGFVILQQQAAQRVLRDQRRVLREAQAKQEIEQRAQQEERAKQERERIAAENARQEARKIEQIEREFAERFLQQLLTNKEIKAEDARQRALKELPALVKLPLAEIESLINRKIAPPAAGAAPSPVDAARAALAKGDLDGVFKEADKEKQQGRELAMLEGTAALAKFRGSPKLEWNTRALAAFQRAMALADPNSATEWEAWTDAAVSATSVLYDLARYAEAEPLLRDCLRLREANSGPNSPGVAAVLNNLALLLKETNRLAEAEPLFRRAMVIGERSDGRDHATGAIRLNNLAMLLKSTNRLAEAEPLYRRALAIVEKSYGPDHPDVARFLNNLAVLLKSTNRLAEAEPLQRRALAIDEKSYGPNHPDVAIQINNLAWSLDATDRLAEAEPLQRRALAIVERSHGADHPLVASFLNNLAMLLKSTNRLAEAEPLYRRALAIDEKSYGPNHPDVATDANNLALLLQTTNRLAEAEPLMARAVRVRSRSQRLTGHEHPALRANLEDYGQLLRSLKVTVAEIPRRIEAAREVTGELSPIVPEVERLLGPAKPVVDVLASLERQYKAQGKPAVYFLKPNEPIAPHLDELLRPSGDGLTSQGVAALRGGAHADAVVFYEAALELMADRPVRAPAKLGTRMNRALALRRLGFLKQASDELSSLVREIEKVPGAESILKGRALYNLAFCQLLLGDRAAARESAERSLAAYDSAPKAEPIDPDTRRESETLLADVKLLSLLKDFKVPPPADAMRATAALEAARARYRTREALTKLPLNQEATPLLDQLLGPAKSTQEVFEALDRQYREQGKPSVWFLPLNEPITPHLDELLGKPSK